MMRCILKVSQKKMIQKQSKVYKQGFCKYVVKLTDWLTAWPLIVHLLEYLVRRHDDVMKCFVLCCKRWIWKFQFNRCLLRISEQKLDLMNFGFLRLLFILVVNALAHDLIILWYILHYSKIGNACYNQVYQTIARKYNSIDKI